MTWFTAFGAGESPFLKIQDALAKGESPVLANGLAVVHKALLVTQLFQTNARPILMIAADKKEALQLEQDIAALVKGDVCVYHGRELNLYPAVGMTKELELEKIKSLATIAKKMPAVTITTAEALTGLVMPKAVLLEAVLEVKTGQEIAPEMLAKQLVALGYSRTEQVEGMGQFALRGGILDVFSPADEAPLRLDFWGDTLETISSFDPLSQRSNKKVKRAVFLPTGEVLPCFHKGGDVGFLKDLHALKKKLEKRKEPPEAFLAHLTENIERLEGGAYPTTLDPYFNLSYPQSETILDYLPEDVIYCISELGKVTEHARMFLQGQQEYITSAMQAGFIEGSLAKLFATWEKTFAQINSGTLIVCNQFAGESFGTSFSPKTICSMLAKQLPSYAGSVEALQSDINYYISENFSIVILCKNELRAKRFAEILEKYDIPFTFVFDAAEAIPQTKTCILTIGTLPHGVEFPAQKLVFLTEGQMQAAPKEQKKKKAPKKKGGELLRYTDLAVGDLVVHEHHGIGRYLGLETMEMDGIKKDYIKISYHGNDKLYLPVTQLDLISKYIGTGGEDTKVKLSRMGGIQWREAKTKAKGAAKELAKGLIKLYAARMRQTGYAFSQDSPWQAEFEEKFAYTETNDQLVCTEEIKQDMQRNIPMDRLLCGDVGYGKTEVALRAIMKCVLEGKQAAILVPTTVLAQQHFRTATARFEGFPLTIEVLSRYKTAAQAKKILEQVEKGQIDLLIGTHKILQKSIAFKDLGLLVVDEEQRFGVSHKERLKELSHNVDVLTLSATPIPRTLNMALSGIRDMSTIEEPPQNRKPVQTYVLEHNWSLLQDAILRELKRGGQVYYLHNRVEDIDCVAVKIREMTDGATVLVAHGKMDEKALGRAMDAMIAGEAQILVCTSIIETGIDIPNVNTLIIEDADRMGLAQLHQIRGRVGRSNRTSFAYLTYRPGKMLTEIAAKRLSAIQEFVAFNSGFKIALRDLEIRGAGNILGREQSGHMMNVGYDMYLKLLNEAVLEEKGETLPQKVQCTADLAVEANIPAHYVAQAEQRMDLYRRIANITCEKDAEDVLHELTDRFGKPPASALVLIEIAKLRARASAVGITEITQKKDLLRFRFAPQQFCPEAFATLYEMPNMKRRVRILAGEVPKLELLQKEGSLVLEQAIEFVNFLEKNEN